ncbi:MAG TPA: molybdopterin-dependent oxidoreductase [Terriglobales bacterium]|nr:molybdopterin-dependent oxidoreductase [Terriglobales bacterium]
MERRDFLKFGVLTGATATLTACEKPVQQLARFVPEEDLVPGVATWKPSLCTLCPAGCGVMVRIMDGDAEVVRNGQRGIIKMGLAKKLEGNPRHPVNRGKLCARGQAGLQVTYHPDRVRTPLKRSASRGSGDFHEIGWQDALREVVTQLEQRSPRRPDSIRFVTGDMRGQRRELINKFLAGLGAPPAAQFAPLGEPVLRRANLLGFGHASLPSFDLERSSYVISFGADFLGTWNSPVSQSIGYGEMRRGRAGRRGKFVQVEQRMSQTGANADEWVSSSPGSEGLLALGLAHVLVKEGLRPNPPVTGPNQDVLARLKNETYSPAQIANRTGVSASRIERLAREMAAQPPAIALIGGAPLAHTNGLFSALAVNLLNMVLGSLGSPGGMFFAPATFSKKEASSPTDHADFVAQLLSGGFENTEVLFLDNTNPVFATPPGWQVSEKLQGIPFIVSFSRFLDETSVLADLILPDHSPLESWLDDVPESGTSEAVLTLAAPAMRPLHNTRAMPDVLLEIAHSYGGSVGETLPWKTFEEMLQSSYRQLVRAEPCDRADGFDKLWEKILQQGGWWDGPCQVRSPEATSLPFPAPEFVPPAFDGSEEEFPFYFQPYVSQAFLDGSLAHLPWMQELPDALATVMWGSWLELNPKTAERLQIQQGDLVQVRSRHGTLETPAVLNPGIAFDVVAMPMGQGHAQFGRYAARRGANPMNVVAPVQVEQVGSLAWAATRVSLARIGTKARLSLASGALYEREKELELR